MAYRLFQQRPDDFFRLALVLTSSTVRFGCDRLNNARSTFKSFNCEIEVDDVVVTAACCECNGPFGASD